MKVLVGSVQFSPIFKSHCFAFGNQCEKMGVDVNYLFSSEYEWMLPERAKRKARFLGSSVGAGSAFKDGLNPEIRKDLREIIDEIRPDLIYMHNIQPFHNYLIAGIARRRKIRFVQHFHEPYVEDKSPYGRSRGSLISVFELMQAALLRRTDIAVVSSNEGRRLFEIRYPHFKGQLMQIPLMYEDIGRGQSENGNREFATFIGPISMVKGFDIYKRIAGIAHSENPNLKFQIITRKPVDEKDIRDSNNISIFHKPKISDEEIVENLSRSHLLIAPYRSVRQSSSVITSYMCGTPVLAMNVGGMKECIDDRFTGFLVNPADSIEEWMKGLNHILSNQEEMSRNCRAIFEKNYSEDNWLKYIGKVLYEGR